MRKAVCRGVPLRYSLTDYPRRGGSGGAAPAELRLETLPAPQESALKAHLSCGSLQSPLLMKPPYQFSKENLKGHFHRRGTEGHLEAEGNELLTGRSLLDSSASICTLLHTFEFSNNKGEYSAFLPNRTHLPFSSVNRLCLFPK